MVNGLVEIEDKLNQYKLGKLYHKFLFIGFNVRKYFLWYSYSFFYCTVGVVVGALVAGTAAVVLDKIAQGIIGTVYDGLSNDY